MVDSALFESFSGILAINLKALSALGGLSGAIVMASLGLYAEE